MIEDPTPLAVPGRGLVHETAFGPGVVDGMFLLAESLGFAPFRIDLEGCADKDAFLERIARAMAFPDWFGRNWDALADCLGDLAWRPAAGYLLVFERCSELRIAAPDEYATALAVLTDAAEAWQSRGVAFRVFVDTA